MDIEVEIKRETPSTGHTCVMCGDSATKTIVIGEVQNSYGDDFEICNSGRCEENALDDALEAIQAIKLNRKQYKEDFKYDHREGK